MVYQPTLFSIVTIMEEGKEDREFFVNYSEHDTKVWLTKTLVWAISNGAEISVMKASPSEIESRPLFTPKPAAVS